MNKIKESLSQLLDLRFIIPMALLTISLIVNGVQCGKNPMSKYLLQRAANALELAIAEKKSISAKHTYAEFQASLRGSKEQIEKNKKTILALQEEVKRKNKELLLIRARIGKMTIGEVVDELKKELGKAAKDENNYNGEVSCEKNNRD